MTAPNAFPVAPDAVIAALDAATGEEAVQALHGSLAVLTNAVMDAPRFLSDVQQRMRLASVCIAEDVALPHARTSAVNRMVMAVGRSMRGLAFDPEHPAVRLVFLIGTPKDAVTEYLRVVAALSRRLREPGVRAGLLAAADEDEFRALLAGGVAARQ